MRRLVAGPWVGEFGWELMSWQGLVRKRARGYDEIIVCSRKGHEELYADFADKYIPHSLCGVKDCWRMKADEPAKLAKLRAHVNDLPGDLMQPKGLVPASAQEFIRFGDPGHVSKYDLIIHAREPIGKRKHHAYPLEYWETIVHEMVGQGTTVACIGTEAHLPPGAIDLRGLPLRYVVDVMSSCLGVAGPSSGPMHLASLCGARHIVWTDRAYYSAIRGHNRQRYERVWNPLRTPCRVIDEHGWHPKPEVLLPILAEEIDNERRIRCSEAK
jgi:ADP-heptose:LPS heptosyltransferase